MPFTAILLLDAGAIHVALLALADLLPSFIVGLPIGVWVDRVRRLPLMVGADLLRAAVLVSIPVAALFDALTLAQLYVVAFLASALTVLFNVSQVSVLPALVRKEELLEANSKTAATQSISEVGAFGVSGWLVQLLSGPGAVLINAVSFVLSALLLKRIRVEEAQPPSLVGRPGMLREIGEGLKLVAGHPVLRPLALSQAALWFGMRVFGTVIALFALRELGFQPGVLSMIFAVGGISSLLGALGAGPFTTRLGVGPAMSVAFVLGAASLLVLPLAQGAGVLAVTLLVLQQMGDGFILIFMINDVSMRQALTASELLGRVNASFEFVRSAASLAGVLVAGVLGELLGLRPTLFLGGAVVLGGGVYLALSHVRGLKALPLQADTVETSAT